MKKQLASSIKGGTHKVLSDPVGTSRIYSKQRISGIIYLEIHLITIYRINRDLWTCYTDGIVRRNALACDIKNSWNLSGVQGPELLKWKSSGFSKKLDKYSSASTLSTNGE